MHAISQLATLVIHEVKDGFAVAGAPSKLRFHRAKGPYTRRSSAAKWVGAPRLGIRSESDRQHEHC